MWFLAAGFAYALCCQLLDRPATLAPGETITQQELSVLVEAARAAALGRNEPTYQLLLALSKLTGQGLRGSWHMLPDTLTCMDQDHFTEPDGAPSSAQGRLLDVVQAAGIATSPAGADEHQRAAKELLARVLIQTFSPSQFSTLDVLTVLDPEVCICSGGTQFGCWIS